MMDYQVKSPVLFIIYKREGTTSRVFEAIKKAKPKKLYVSANASNPHKADDKEKVNATRRIIDQVDWDCEVIKLFHTDHMLVQHSISRALKWFFSEEKEGIVLEDDCVPNMSFFKYCDELLEKYRYDKRIGRISGSNSRLGHFAEEYSYYFSQFGHSWGWASWHDRVLDFDLEMKNWDEIKKKDILKHVLVNKKTRQSWYNRFEIQYREATTHDVQLAFYFLTNNYVNIIPQNNMISNIGIDVVDSEHIMSLNPFVGLPTDEAEFPLKHPPYIIINRSADEYRMKYFHRKSLPGRVFNRCRKKIRSLIKS
jgi:hypothetical protein